MPVARTQSGQRSDQRRRWLFWCVIIAIPVVCLPVTELLLRAFVSEPPLHLVAHTQIRGRSFRSINRAVGRRYFAQPGISVPEPPDVLFRTQKSRAVRRIFCLGESTMEGFPYEYNATAPSFLQARLQSMLPDDTVEVINLGISAIGSTVVRDLLPEVLECSPDLIVLYVGHNEYYGAFGPASAVAASRSQWLIRLHLALLRFRTYMLLRDAIGGLGQAISAPGTSGETTLMHRMVGETAIPLGSETYQKGLSLYRENIRAIIEKSEAAGVPLLFATPVSNVRDLPPFAGAFAPGTSDSVKQRWSVWMDEGSRQLAEGNSGAGITAFRHAIVCDSTHALGHYKLAGALYEGDRFAEALRHYLRAKDLDQVRFRAPEELTSTLLAICRASNVPVARIDSSFSANTEHGIPGHELFLEHVHPTIGGYALMARTLAETIRRLNLIRPSREWRAPLPDSAYLSLCGVSPFDDTLGSVKIGMLKRHWPFPEGPAVVRKVNRDTLSSLITTALEQNLPWTTTRLQVADHYARRGEYAAARRECVAITRAIPFSFQPWVLMGDYAAREGNSTAARELYRHSLDVEQNPYAHMKLGVLFMEESKPSAALERFEAGFQVNNALGGILTVAEHATGRYLAGLACAQSGRRGDAIDHLQHALALQPGMTEAKDLLRRLQ